MFLTYVIIKFFVALVLLVAMFRTRIDKIIVAYSPPYSPPPAPKRRRRSDNSLSGAFRAQGYMRKFGIKTPRIMRCGKWW